MLELQNIRNNVDEIISRLKVKNFDASTLIHNVLELDNKRKEIQKQADDFKAESNAIAKEIGMLFKTGKRDDAEQKKQKTVELKQKVKDLDDDLRNVEKELEAILLQIPNIPHLDVPSGNSENDNEIIAEQGKKPVFNFKAIPHWVLAEKYNIIDFDLGNKVTGAGFPFYVGKGAKLQRALINFFLDKAQQAGYIEYVPPLMVNEDSAYGTGQLPDKDGQMYYVNEDNLYLIPTAEVPITNIHRNKIYSEKDLPIKNTGYTPCFRREAGSYGKNVRGLNRLHQFDKVEIVQIQTPENSYEALEEMLLHSRNLLEELELPYRVLKLCGGDISFTSALTYDLEVYSAAQERWLEVSSVSNFESYQANRLKLRYKTANKKTQLLHTLNGSALALPRIIAALLENNQTQNGIELPKVLHAYCGFKTI